MKRIYAFINGVCSFLVAMEADFTERRVNDARLDRGHLDIAVNDIDADAVAECLDGCLCRAVDSSACIRIKACRRAKVDDCLLYTSPSPRDA